MRTKLPYSVLCWAALLAFSLGFTTPAATIKNAASLRKTAQLMAMASCDPGDPAFTDFDGDGVGDDCDVDDDNDGVLDTNETTFNPFLSTSCENNLIERIGFTTAFTLNTQLVPSIGLIVGTDATFATGFPMGLTCSEVSFGNSAGTFTAYIHFKFVQPGNASVPVPLDSMTITSDCAGSNELPFYDAYDINGNFLYTESLIGTPYGANHCVKIKPAANVDVYSIRVRQVASAARLTGLSLKGISPYGDRDTDHDGIADRLDPDSDNDGCNDVVEAGGGDDDNNGILGVGTPTVDVNGQVTGAGGYTADFADAFTATRILIGTAPGNQSVANGGTTSFTVSATATSTTAYTGSVPNYTDPSATNVSAGITYQWQEDNGSGFGNIADGGIYSGATTQTLTLTGVPYAKNGAVYRVVVSHPDRPCPEQPQAALTVTGSSCDPGNPAFVDTDNDGVGNDCDVDDDNDGILDTDDGCETLLTGEFSGTFGTSPSAAAFYRDLQNAPGGGYSYGPGTGGNNAAGKYTVANQAGAIANHAAAIWEYPGHTDGSATDCYLLVNGSTSVGTFFAENLPLTGGNGYNYQFWHRGAYALGPVGAYNLRIEIRRVSDNLVVGTADTGPIADNVWRSLSVNFTAPTSETYRATLVNVSVQAQGNDFSVDDITLVNINCNDFDGDGVADNMDLDSDNDGCADVLEAGGTDGDGDGRLGTETPTVDASGQVTGQGGYTGSFATVRNATRLLVDTPPANQSIESGDNTSFTVASTATSTTAFAAGVPNYADAGATNVSGTIAYQWQEDTGGGFADIANGGIYSGATTATLTLTGVPLAKNGAVYRVLITHPDNACIAEQRQATLTVTGCLMDISGTIYDDPTGVDDGLGGTPVNGTTLGLYVTLITTAPVAAQAVVPVSAAGTYLFTNVLAGTHKLVLGTTSTGNTASLMPAGYFAIGEGAQVVSGAGAGDGDGDGELGLTADCAGIVYESARIAADVTYANNNFVISTEDPLPVTLISFSLVKEESNVRLNWNTSAETNSDRFEIQRSRDGKQWSKLGEVKAKGESTTNVAYTYLDQAPASGRNFYRLKMIDHAADRLDGTFAYSSIKSISVDGKEMIVAYPNPTDGPVHLTITDWKRVKSVTAIDITGRKMFETGRPTSERLLLPALSKGISVLKIQYEDGNMETIRVVRH
jgi:hypothetical protein